MQPILKPKRKTSLSYYLIGFLVFLVAVVSFIFSIKYSGEKNKEYPVLTYDAQLPIPDCDSKGGFYTEAFEIRLQTNNHNCKIYYTLDGTEPSLKSAVYGKPILIQNKTSSANILSSIPTSPRWKPPVGDVFKGTVVRAISVTDENKRSDELIRTYFVDEKGSKRYSFPVVAITVNPDDLFGYKNGIYVLGKNYDDKNDYVKKDVKLDLPWWKYPSNYLKKGNNAERPAFIEFFESTNEPAFQSKVGLRINGNATRGYAQKSLRVNFRTEYGSGTLNYKLFQTDSVTKFHSFILRNSGNDWDKTMFRDAFMQSLLTKSKLEIENNRPVIVFINGEYWGIHNICERFDENYISEKYKMSKDSIVILEMGGTVTFGKKKDADSFKNLLSFIKTNDLSKTSNYENVAKAIDVENFIDFVIANVYYCNSDWPNNNVKYWRYKTSAIGNDSLKARDGRWRWMLYDTDYGFGNTGTDAYKMNLIEKARIMGSIGIIFSGLLNNKKFVNRFLEKFQYHLNTSFEATTVLHSLDEFEQMYSPEMRENINRWRVIGSFETWKNNVQEMREFATKRPAIQAEQLNEYFKLSGTSRISIKK